MFMVAEAEELVKQKQIELKRQGREKRYRSRSPEHQKTIKIISHVKAGNNNIIAHLINDSTIINHKK